MKKLFLALVAVLAMAATANAQNIGVRGVFGSSSGAEISYQHPLSGNRLEFDLGWHSHEGYDYINLSVVYQWKWNLSGNFDWYAGLGGNAGMWSGNNESSLGLGFLAQVGIEYNFQAIPLQASLDFRPQWDVLGSASGFGYGLALGLRYRLGE